ncbi:MULTISPECIES: LiaF domain-containing protein [unclassified Fusibacter]|uniref:LiaF transmembrane domain-containing protein n=1 Tax=unclassified Fusibacter TaxID=2624464 RepID=UPI001011189D|nr:MULTISPECIES: LiaF domain-containing protein [unclassified Fusibacter]MCK8058926.1 cell wall-active antibiotics response protein [Fusibacter sp. A2]NPE22001.1 hypothetical protein [Fusibacter sp. A1]RXV61566.1 hypothetical protein DWB64_09160 [Fusibacter sp. A1]
MNKRSSSFIFGVVIVIVGLYLLADNLNLGIVNTIDFVDIISVLWPMLFIGWGYEALQKRNYVVGAIFSSIGLHFLLDNLTFISPIFGFASSIVWPAFIIILGVYIMLAPPKEKQVKRNSDFSSRGRSSNSSHKFREFDPDTDNTVIRPAKVQRHTGKTSEASFSDSIDQVISSVDEVVSNISRNVKENIKGHSDTTYTVTLSKDSDKPTVERIYDATPKPESSKVNLNKETPKQEQVETQATTKTNQEANQNQQRKAKKMRSYSASFNSKKLLFKEEDFVDGDNTIDITCVFGEVKLGIPRDVNIELEGQVTLGDLKFLNEKYEGFSSAITDRYVSPSGATKTVHINATVILGDIKIKLI